MTRAKRSLKINLEVTGRSIEISRLVQIGRGDDANQENIFEVRYTENAKCAVITILGGKFFFWHEKIFFEDANISRNVPTLTIRGSFFRWVEKMKIFS
jgi:hypothetical protein